MSDATCQRCGSTRIDLIETMLGLGRYGCCNCKHRWLDDAATVAVEGDNNDG